MVVTTQNPLGQGLLVDTTKFGRVAIREAMLMRLGYANDDFTKNLISWVAEERLVLTVERPAAVLKITSVPGPGVASTETKSSKSSSK